AQKKYKIAMEVTDSKLNNFSNSLLAKTDNNTPNTQEISKEDFLKKNFLLQSLKEPYLLNS
ncbi:MAG: hypothetical protein WHV67_05285, partial [Thermoanaerobaculia bacterium]